MKKLLTVLCAFVLAFGIIGSTPIAAVESKTEFRREISNTAPAWIVHIDTWVTPDPQAIIDLIPEELRPFVIFNISLSINGFNDEAGWGIVEYGYETARSWLTVCAENGVWATVQPASGSACHFPDYKELSEYEDSMFREFYERFPNFLGFNYCEQFWGYGDWVPVMDRYTHLANLLQIANEYGGYLFVSWCGNQWSPDISPNAMIERNKKWAKAVMTYGDNYVLCTKYTQHSYIEDMESQVFGNWLSEFCGNWGVRYDESGWTSGKEGVNDYTMSTGLPIMIEEMLLNGATVIDGPELVFMDDFKETNATTQNGWTQRNWDTHKVFINVAMDMMKKVVDGTIRIPTREEVIKRTKVYIYDDILYGDNDAKCSIPVTMSEGLYRMDGDGGLRDNTSPYKKSGRYAIIPIILRTTDDIQDSGALVINKSKWSTRWKSEDSKVKEFNKLYKSLYSGDLYAGNYKNKWLAYNPYKSEKTAKSTLSLRYNSCDKLTLSFARYTSAIVTEFADKLEIYLNNYDDNNVNKSVKNTITVSGCDEKPTVKLINRGKASVKPTYTTSYKDGRFTVTVTSNGPVDIVINCKGNSIKKNTAAKDKALTPPEAPPVYYGFIQHEAEHFMYKNATVTKNGARGSIDGYEGQGFVDIKNQGSLKDTFVIAKDGKYKISVKYICTKKPSDLDLYVNGKKVVTFDLKETEKDKWISYAVTMTLKKGTNTIELRAKAKSESSLIIDRVRISPK